MDGDPLSNRSRPSEKEEEILREKATQGRSTFQSSPINLERNFFFVQKFQDYDFISPRHQLQWNLLVMTEPGLGRICNKLTTMRRAASNAALFKASMTKRSFVNGDCLVV